MSKFKKGQHVISRCSHHSTWFANKKLLVVEDDVIDNCKVEILEGHAKGESYWCDDDELQIY